MFCSVTCDDDIWHIITIISIISIVFVDITVIIVSYPGKCNP